MRYLYLLLFCSLNCLAQQSPVQKIAESCATADLKKNLYYLASPQMKGRLMGSHEDTLASVFIAGQFKKQHLEAPFLLGGSYFQTITAMKQDDKLAFTINGKAYSKYDGWDIYPNKPVRLNNLGVVLTDHIAEQSFCSDIPKMNLKGKAIIITQQLFISVYNKLDSIEILLQKAGAKMLICASPQMVRRLNYLKDEKYLPDYKLPLYFQDQQESVLTEISLTPERQQEIIGGVKLAPGQHFTDLKARVGVTLERNYLDTHAPNVIGMIKGTDTTKACIVLSAHHDHDGGNAKIYYPGSVDNASGTVAIMEVAALMHKAAGQGLKPQRTILFISYTGEERGLLGAEWYAAHPVIPMKKTYAVINIDMFGRTDTLHQKNKSPDSANYVYMLVKDSLKIGLRNALIAANNSLPKLALDNYYENPKYEMRRLMGSDQFPLYLKGVPFIRIDCGFCKDYHKITDTPDKINYELLTRQTQLTFLTLWNLANN